MKTQKTHAIYVGLEFKADSAHWTPEDIEYVRKKMEAALVEVADRVLRNPHKHGEIQLNIM